MVRFSGSRSSRNGVAARHWHSLSSLLSSLVCECRLRLDSALVRLFVLFLSRAFLRRTSRPFLLPEDTCRPIFWDGDALGIRKAFLRNREDNEARRAPQSTNVILPKMCVTVAKSARIRVFSLYVYHWVWLSLMSCHYIRCDLAVKRGQNSGIADNRNR